ncbi:MAG: heliorhodopsin HeR [Actinomycetota bacterium]|nr:heliorhodopsin HeR [Actinomycetota bacterium]
MTSSGRTRSQTEPMHGAAPVAEVGDSAFRRLRLANLALVVAHLGQAALILALANGFTIGVTGSFATGPPGTPPGEPSTLFELAIAPAIAAFLALAALDHLLVALPGFADRYRRGLSEGRNLFRWSEYSLSASLMIVLIAMLTGITDVGALVAIFGVNAAMILFGWLVETTGVPGRNVNWTAFGFGCVAGAVPWIAITIALVGAEQDGEVPTFVYGIFVSLFVLFNSFAVNMALQQGRVGRWRNYLFGEAGYLVLSLVAKSALAWQIFAGTLAD